MLTLEGVPLASTLYYKYCFIVPFFPLIYYCLHLLSGKLLSKAQKIAYTLLNKVGNPREGTSIMLGDRVSKNTKHVSVTTQASMYVKRCKYTEPHTISKQLQ